MTTTDSSTHSSKSDPPDATRRRLGALVALSLLGVATPGRTDTAPDVLQLRLERSDEGVFLSAQVQFELPPLVEDALNKGIPVYFLAEAELLRDRWYWADRKIGAAQRHMRLTYQPLTRRWRLQVSPQPIATSGLGVALSQHFDDLPEAVAAIQRIARWRLADADDLEPDAAHSVDFRFRLDPSQLPRTLQIGVIGRADWNLSVARKVRLFAEDTR